MYEIRIKRKRESIFLKHNSRVYSGAIESCTPGFTEAGLARVISHEGTFVAYGWYDEASWTTLHLLSWDEETVPDDSWLRLAVLSSVARRASVSNTQAMRLVHGEADFIPGLAADIYLDTLRIIISARYANDKLDVLLPALFEATGARRASVSVDAAYARLEHLGQRRRFFTPGGECGPFDDESVRFSESGIWYEIGGGKAVSTAISGTTGTSSSQMPQAGGCLMPAPSREPSASTVSGEVPPLCWLQTPPSPCCATCCSR